ncbi:MAG TPA: cytochrome c maturation protein CcmE [Vicinamibacterales bacterium]|nr:cytochrome c maturation protein CcmE [Vicinamibacterales bacterium]
MSKKATRAVVSAVVVLTALIAVLWTTVSEGAQYYKHVDEVMNDPSPWYGKNMQLHGFVVDKSIEQRPDTLDYRFKIKSGDFAVTALYSGVVPDTFKDGAEVVLTGRLDASGFKAHIVTAKCPSKYEAAGPGAPAKTR